MNRALIQCLVEYTNNLFQFSFLFSRRQFVLNVNYLRYFSPILRQFHFQLNDNKYQVLIISINLSNHIPRVLNDQ